MKKIALIISFTSLILSTQNLQASDKQEPLGETEEPSLKISSGSSSTSSESEEKESSFNSLTMENKNLKDKDVIQFLADMLDPEVEKRPNLLQLKDNRITDSGAISLAALLDYLDVRTLDLRGNPIGLVGLQAIFTKACAQDEMLIFKFSTKNKNISKLQKLSSRKFFLSKEGEEESELEAYLAKEKS